MSAKLPMVDARQGMMAGDGETFACGCCKTKQEGRDNYELQLLLG